jgi:NAD(P)-dependent dehydrogenase (short-subunit alcohol dehydrogenase family)
VTQGITNRGSVFITGTSTGIGAATVDHLAESGFRVFAGVRRDVDGRELLDRYPKAVTPVILDITDGEQVDAAVQLVSSSVGADGLSGLVNNAGIVRPGPLEFQPLADFRMQLEVNLFGHVAVTQGFLPLIRRGGGRIVNVGSIGGRMALPLHGAYSASKFAIEGLTDALRLELRQWGIYVCLVDPGATASAIFAKTLDAIDDLTGTIDEDAYALYREQVAAVRAFVVKTATDTAPPAEVARAIAHALTSRKPKTRYLAGKGATEAALLAHTLSDRLKDKAIAKEVGIPDPY